VGRPKCRIKKKCVICNEEFEVVPSSKKKTCNKTCSNKLAYKNGRKVIRNREYNYDRWIRLYGKNEADRRQEIALSNISKGLLANPREKQRASARKTIVEWNKKQKGKTLEEIHGDKKAKEIKRKLSKRSSGKNNPSYGKVYEQGGKSVSGRYKGRWFRSILELSFMVHLEKEMDLDNIMGEVWKVPYRNSSGVDRTYTPDFYDPASSTVYECKMSWCNNSKDNQEKFKAAEEFFEKKNIKFRVVTENDFHKLSFKEAEKMENVNLNKGSLKYFRK